MNSRIITTIFVLVTSTCLSQMVLAGPYLERAIKLDILATYSGKKDGWERKDNAVEYFQDFPATYGDFIDFFGYMGGSYVPDMVTVASLENEDVEFYRFSQKGVLSDKSNDYISLFFATSAFVDEQSFIEKSLDICVGGHWGADAIGMFQHELTRHMQNNRAEYAKIMAVQYEKEKVSSILRFLADNPHQPNKVDWIINEICTVDKTRPYCQNPGKFEKSLFPEGHFGHH